MKDLQGKKIACSVGTFRHNFLLTALKTVDLTADDIELLNLQTSDIITALQAGEAEAGVLSANNYASVSDISQNTGGHNLTSENAADISGGTADSSARYYTVKKGDSLMSISKAVYHTTAMIPEICNANQIENMDMIYEGQQLLLP